MIAGGQSEQERERWARKRQEKIGGQLTTDDLVVQTKFSRHTSEILARGNFAEAHSPHSTVIAKSLRRSTAKQRR